MPQPERIPRAMLRGAALLLALAGSRCAEPPAPTPAPSPRFESDPAARARLEQLRSAINSTGRCGDECVGELAGLHAKYPSSAEVTTVLGSVYLQQARWAELAAVLEAMPAAQRTRADSKLLAKTYLTLGRHADALAVADTLPSMTPPDVEAVEIRANALFHLSRYEELEGLLGPLRPILETSAPDLLVLLGLAAMQRGDSAAAVPLLQRAIELRPESIAARNALGRALAVTGKDALADEQFEAATKLLRERDDAVARKRRLVSLGHDLEEAFAQRRFTEAERIIGEMLPDADETLARQLQTFLQRIRQEQGLGSGAPR